MRAAAEGGIPEPGAGATLLHGAAFLQHYVQGRVQGVSIADTVHSVMCKALNLKFISR